MHEVLVPWPNSQLVAILSLLVHIYSAIYAIQDYCAFKIKPSTHAPYE